MLNMITRQRGNFDAYGYYYAYRPRGRIAASPTATLRTRNFNRSAGQKMEHQHLLVLIVARTMSTLSQRIPTAS